jgi:hypothetical protein
MNSVVLTLLVTHPSLRGRSVKSVLIYVFFLAPRDQLRQQNQPATSSTAGYPKQPATSGQPATPAL